MRPRIKRSLRSLIPAIGGVSQLSFRACRVNLQQNSRRDAVDKALSARPLTSAVFILSSSDEPTRLVEGSREASAYILAAELLKSALIIYHSFSQPVKVSPASALKGVQGDFFFLFFF